MRFFTITMNFALLLCLQGTWVLTFRDYKLSGEGVYYTSALSFISLFKWWGRTTPGVLLLTYWVTPASKTPGRYFKIPFY